MSYVLSQTVDFSVLTKQAGDVTTLLIRNNQVVASLLTKGVKRTDAIIIDSLLKQAQPGDGIAIQIGDPKGFQISEMFTLE